MGQRYRDLPLGQVGQLPEQTARYWGTSAREVLLGLNTGNEQALDNRGFTVDPSPPVKKVKQPATPRGEAVESEHATPFWPVPSLGEGSGQGRLTPHETKSRTTG